MEYLLQKKTYCALCGEPLVTNGGRFAQGNKHGVVAQDAIDNISREQVLRDRDITYAQFVCDHRPLKSEE